MGNAVVNDKIIFIIWFIIYHCYLKIKKYELESAITRSNSERVPLSAPSGLPNGKQYL